MRTGSLLTLGLFAAVLAYPLSIQAGEKPNQAQSEQRVSDKQQDKGGQKIKEPDGPEDCFLDKGCLAQTVTATSGQKSIQGTTCKTGTMACSFPLASCAMGGTKHCRTYDLNGQGNCTCACIAP